MEVAQKLEICAWTGLNSTLKDNIKIGNNVLVAAGAVVIHDVEDQDVVAGVPAKSIKDKVKSDLIIPDGRTRVKGKIFSSLNLSVINTKCEINSILDGKSARP